jgi:uncharacterized damage-inducible protein DinB
MTVNDLQILYDYGYWANERFFDVLSQLTDEQFIQPVAGSYGSLRNTLVHMLSAEWGWLERCGGAARGPVLIASDYPTLDSVQRRWQEIEEHLRRFLANLRDEDLERSVEFSFGNGPKQVRRLGELMHHAAVHGVHHRGQIALLLRCLGHAPGNVDILLYYGPMTAGSAAKSA